jgi:hypothetical protein
VVQLEALHFLGAHRAEALLTRCNRLALFGCPPSARLLHQEHAYLLAGCSRSLASIVEGGSLDAKLPADDAKDALQLIKLGRHALAEDGRQAPPVDPAADWRQRARAVREFERDGLFGPSDLVAIRFQHHADVFEQRSDLVVEHHRRLLGLLALRGGASLARVVVLK